MVSKLIDGMDDLKEKIAFVNIFLRDWHKESENTNQWIYDSIIRERKVCFYSTQKYQKTKL
jgi:hypothetical protein